MSKTQLPQFKKNESIISFKNSKYFENLLIFHQKYLISLMCVVKVKRLNN